MFGAVARLLIAVLGKADISIVICVPLRVLIFFFCVLNLDRERLLTKPPRDLSLPFNLACFVDIRPHFLLLPKPHPPFAQPSQKQDTTESQEIMDNTEKPAAGRIHFGSLEVIEAKKREAAARLAAATAASPGTPPVTGASTPSRGTTLDDLSKKITFYFGVLLLCIAPASIMS